MTLGDVADRIIATEHTTVFVCLENKRSSNLMWFMTKLRECLAERESQIEGVKTTVDTIIINTPRKRVLVRVTCQDEMISRPEVLQGYVHSTPLFTAYSGGWAEATIQ